MPYVSPNPTAYEAAVAEGRSQSYQAALVETRACLEAATDQRPS